MSVIMANEASCVKDKDHETDFVCGENYGKLEQVSFYRQILAGLQILEWLVGHSHWHFPTTLK